MSISGPEKVAILLMVIKNQVAKEIVNMLDEQEIIAISQVMSKLGNVPSNLTEKVITEFLYDFYESLSVVGNIKSVERFLKETLVEDRGRLEQILGTVTTSDSNDIWKRLEYIDEQLLVDFLRNEHPQTTAIILTRISSIFSAKIMSLLKKDYAFEVVKRMLSIERVKPKMLSEVEKVLQNEFPISTDKSYQRDNNKVIAEIFDNLDKNTESKFMTMLEEYSIDSAKKVKRWMFSFSDLARLDVYSMQALMKNIDKSKLSIALRGTSQEIISSFTRSMSQRAAKLLMEEMEIPTSAGVRDIEIARLDIINVAKDMVAKGLIKLDEQSNIAE